MNNEIIKECWETILTEIGENKNRDGLKDTPTRIAKMYNELFRGYDETQKPKITVFDNGSDRIIYDQMITDTGNFYSHCEHHGVPFIGKYWFGYIPNTEGKILGLSKVARIVDFHAAKFQIQERLVQDIVNDLWNALTTKKIIKPFDALYATEPLGMGLFIKATHLCKSMRGVKKEGSMTTCCLKGNFHEDNVKQEFMRIIG